MFGFPSRGVFDKTGSFLHPDFPYNKYQKKHPALARGMEAKCHALRTARPKGAPKTQKLYHNFKIQRRNFAPWMHL